MFTSSCGSIVLPYVTKDPTIAGRIFSRGTSSGFFQGSQKYFSREVKNTFPRGGKNGEI